MKVIKPFGPTIGITKHTNTTVNKLNRFSEQVVSNSGLTKKYDFDVTFVDRAQGRLRLTMTDAVTGTLAEGRYVYDVFVTSANGTKTKVVAGMVLVQPGVSF